MTIRGTPETSSREHNSGSSSSSNSCGSSGLGPATDVTFGIFVSASAAFIATESASSTAPSSLSTSASHCSTHDVLPCWMPSLLMSSALPAPCVDTQPGLPPPRSPAPTADRLAAPPELAPSSVRSSAFVSSFANESPPRPSYFTSALALSSTEHDRRPCVGCSLGGTPMSHFTATITSVFPRRTRAEPEAWGEVPSCKVMER